jgi:hypothetical protein
MPVPSPIPQTPPKHVKVFSTTSCSRIHTALQQLHTFLSKLFIHAHSTYSIFVKKPLEQQVRCHFLEDFAVICHTNIQVLNSRDVFFRLVSSLLQGMEEHFRCESAMEHCDVELNVDICHLYSVCCQMLPHTCEKPHEIRRKHSPKELVVLHAPRQRLKNGSQEDKEAMVSEYTRGKATAMSKGRAGSRG